MTTIDEIIEVLEKSASVAVLPHVSADGDCLGSGLALGLALRKRGKHVVIYIEEEIPYVYSFLPGKELVRVYDGQNPGHDTAVALDTGDIERLGKRAEIFKNARVTVNIDHHATNYSFAEYNFVRPERSAVGEIIYDMLVKMGTEMDTGISTCLYVAITTDTGGFRYSNTTPQTHRIAAELIKNGVNVAEISQKVFDTVSLEKLRLMSLAINTIELFSNGRIAFLAVTEEMMRNAGAKEEDCDGIVNLGRNIRGVELAVLLRQLENGEVKVNLRSNCHVDVAAVANKFSGVGHKKAAGCTIKGEIGHIRAMVLGELEKALNRE